MLIDLLILSHSSAFFTQLRPTYPRMELSSGDLALFQLLTIKTMLYRHLHRPIWWKQFLNWDSLLSNMYRFLSCWQNLTTTPNEGSAVQVKIDGHLSKHSGSSQEKSSHLLKCWWYCSNKTEAVYPDGTKHMFPFTKYILLENRPQGHVWALGWKIES